MEIAMKKFIFALIISTFAFSANSAQMECMVDTAAYDQWGTGHCFSFEYTLDTASNVAIWRLKNVTKTISSVIWSDKTTGCSTSATQCSKAIRPYRTHTGTATILYTDNTWEVVSAVAEFETGF